MLVRNRTEKYKHMTKDQQNREGSEGRMPPADTGNASNPSPHDQQSEPNQQSQLLDEKAEKYLREAGNIEDEPDAQDQEEADETRRTNTK